MTACAVQRPRPMLIYPLLHLTGYDLSIDDPKQFTRQPHPGPPEFGYTPGVETTTGRGPANAVGFAPGLKVLGA